MVATSLSKYLVGLGASITFAGFVVGLFSITSLVCRPFCGVMADRLNNIWLLIVSNLLMSIGLLGFAFTNSMPLMILFRVCNGVGFSINGTVQMALIVHFIPKDRTGEGIGYIGISQLIGSACAPAVGLGNRRPVGDARGIPRGGASYHCRRRDAAVLRDIQPPKKKAAKKGISFGDFFERRAVPFTIPYSTFSFANGVINGYLVMICRRNTASKRWSVYFTMYAVAVFLVRPFSGKLMDKRACSTQCSPA